jgi:uncharacterized integral membrane protein
MPFGYLIVSLLAAGVAVFALQNSAQTSVRFLVWTVDGLPLAAVTLVSLAIGLIVAGVPLWITSWRCRSRARAAESRVVMLEKALADRDRLLLQRPQPPASPSPPPPPAP